MAFWDNSAIQTTTGGIGRNFRLGEHASSGQWVATGRVTQRRPELSGLGAPLFETVARHDSDENVWTTTLPQMPAACPESLYYAKDLGAA